MKLLLIITLASTLLGQERQQRPNRPASLYRLNFTLHIFEQGKDNPRGYTLVLEDRTDGKIRAIKKIPVKTGPETTTYIETGVKCDARLSESESRIRLEVELQYSDLVQGGSETGIIHEWQSRVETTVVANETAVLSTYNDGESGRRYQLDVKAEKLR